MVAADFYFYLPSGERFVVAASVVLASTRKAEGDRKASLFSGPEQQLASPEWDFGSGVEEAAGREASTGPGIGCYIGGGGVNE
eukprot:g39881.t1